MAREKPSAARPTAPEAVPAAPPAVEPTPVVAEPKAKAVAGPDGKVLGRKAVECLRSGVKVAVAERSRNRVESPFVAHDRALAAMHRLREKWLAKSLPFASDVVGMDVGLQVSQGQVTGRWAVRLHVAKKQPEHRIDAKDRVPPFDDDTGVPLDVLCLNYRSAVGPRQGPFSIRVAGDALFGTAGVVVDARAEWLLDALGTRGPVKTILTCAHLLLRNDGSLPTEELEIEDAAGTPVGFAMPAFTEMNTAIDAALIAPYDPAREFFGLAGGAAAGVGEVTPFDVSAGTPIYTLDAVTGRELTGRVLSINGVSVPLEARAGVVNLIDNPIQIASTGPRFAEPGDSGAICYMNGRMVGMIVGVAGGNAIAVSLRAVASRLVFNA